MTGLERQASRSLMVHEHTPPRPERTGATGICAGRDGTVRKYDGRPAMPLTERRRPQGTNRCRRTGRSNDRQVPSAWTSECSAPANQAPPVAECLELLSPSWFLRRQQANPRFETGGDDGTFSTDAFHKSLEASTLKYKVQATLLEMLFSADESGRTTVSGRRIAARLGIRDATVSDHMGKARVHGFLLTKYRYNKSSVHQLTWPGSGLHPPLPGLTPIRAHIWTVEELAWRESLDTDSPQTAPWADGRPPF